MLQVTTRCPNGFVGDKKMSRQEDLLGAQLGAAERGSRVSGHRSSGHRSGTRLAVRSRNVFARNFLSFRLTDAAFPLTRLAWFSVTR